MRNGKILILEADRCLRPSWTRALIREGYHVTGTSSVQKAAKAANQQSYKLFIISVQNPELLNMLLARFPPEMSVLIITTADGINRVVERPGTGIRSFLIRPFSLNKLKATVAQTIDAALLVEESFRSKILMELERVNHLLASETEIDNFFKLVTEISGVDTKADYVSLLARDEKSGKFVIRTEIGDHKPTWKSVCQQVMKTGKPILLDETTQNLSHLHRLTSGAGISAMLCVPIIAMGEVVGAINNIKIAKGDRFTQGDLTLVSILGWWSSMALENVRLYGICGGRRLHPDKLLQEVSLAQENERKRVATDIHDGVTQWMVSAFYRLQASITLISESRFSDLRSELIGIEHAVHSSVTELRRIINNLRSPQLEEHGLAAALLQEIAVLEEEGIKYQVDIGATLPKLPPAVESTIYRIVQEALTNVRKHAKATCVSLCIKSYDNTISVEISDDGQGFNTKEVINSKIPLEHLGLLGIKERVELLCGNLSIDSGIGEGTSISVTFPVASRLTMKTKVPR